MGVRPSHYLPLFTMSGEAKRPKVKFVDIARINPVSTKRSFATSSCEDSHDTISLLPYPDTSPERTMASDFAVSSLSSVPTVTRAVDRHNRAMGLSSQWGSFHVRWFVCSFPSLCIYGHSFVLS